MGGAGESGTVTPTWETRIRRLGGGGLVARAALLLLAFVVLWLFMAPLAWFLDGSVGLLASGFAIAVCLLAGWLALIVTSLIAPPQNPVAHVGVGMAVRMSLPLVACLLVVRRPGSLNDAGFAWYLIIAFLLGLLLETVMSVGQLKSV